MEILGTSGCLCWQGMLPVGQAVQRHLGFSFFPPRYACRENPQRPGTLLCLQAAACWPHPWGFLLPVGLNSRRKILPWGSWGCLQADPQQWGAWSAACEQAETPCGLEGMQKECPAGRCNPLKQVLVHPGRSKQPGGGFWQSCKTTGVLKGGRFPSASPSGAPSSPAGRHPTLFGRGRILPAAGLALCTGHPGDVPAPIKVPFSDGLAPSSV